MALGTQGGACDLGAVAARLICSTWDSQGHRRSSTSGMGDKERRLVYLGRAYTKAHYCLQLHAWRNMGLAQYSRRLNQSL